MAGNERPIFGEGAAHWWLKAEPPTVTSEEARAIVDKYQAELREWNGEFGKTEQLYPPAGQEEKEIFIDI